MPERPRTFTLSEALATLPALRSLTGRAVARVERICASFAGRGAPGEDVSGDDPRLRELEGRVHEIVAEWAAEVASLGCEVKGLWLVDWDTGAGYYCWRWPEETIAHFHSYEDGYAGRMPIN